MTLSVQGLSLLEVSPWNGEVGFWQTRQSELGCGANHNGCVVKPQDTMLRTLCASQTCMHLLVSRGVVASVSTVLDFVTFGKSPHPSELQISSVNQAAILNLPKGGMDHLEFEVILI